MYIFIDVKEGYKMKMGFRFLKVESLMGLIYANNLRGNLSLKDEENFGW